MANKSAETAKNETQSDTAAPTETTSAASGKTAASESLTAARQKRAAEMSIAGKKDTAKAEKAKDEKPKFAVNEARKAELLAMSDAELLEAAEGRMRPVDASNRDIYSGTGNTVDNLNGQDVSRSAIRSAIVEFVNSRRGKKAHANVICAYMHLASGVSYKGKFDFGYITTKDGATGNRGMVARNLLSLAERVEPIKQETPAEENADA